MDPSVNSTRKACADSTAVNANRWTAGTPRHLPWGRPHADARRGSPSWSSPDRRRSLRQPTGRLGRPGQLARPGGQRAGRVGEHPGQAHDPGVRAHRLDQEGRRPGSQTSPARSRARAVHRAPTVRGSTRLSSESAPRRARTGSTGFLRSPDQPREGTADRSGQVSARCRQLAQVRSGDDLPRAVAGVDGHHRHAGRSCRGQGQRPRLVTGGPDQDRGLGQMSAQLATLGDEARPDRRRPARRPARAAVLPGPLPDDPQPRVRVLGQHTHQCLEDLLDGRNPAPALRPTGPCSGACRLRSADEGGLGGFRRQEERLDRDGGQVRAEPPADVVGLCVGLGDDRVERLQWPAKRSSNRAARVRSADLRPARDGTGAPRPRGRPADWSCATGTGMRPASRRTPLRPGPGRSASPASRPRAGRWCRLPAAGRDHTARIRRSRNA